MKVITRCRPLPASERCKKQTAHRDKEPTSSGFGGSWPRFQGEGHCADSSPSGAWAEAHRRPVDEQEWRPKNLFEGAYHSPTPTLCEPESTFKECCDLQCVGKPPEHLDSMKALVQYINLPSTNSRQTETNFQNFIWTPPSSVSSFFDSRNF